MVAAPRFGLAACVTAWSGCLLYPLSKVSPPEKPEHPPQCGGQRQAGQWPGAPTTQCQRVGEGSACEDSFSQSNVVDIVWVVDNSGSMSNEVAGVRENVNSFAAIIAASGLDYHIVFVTQQGVGTSNPTGIFSTSDNAICVPQPLAGANCGASARFLPVAHRVESNDGPAILMEELPAFRSFLRPSAQTSVVFVTDDNSSRDATTVLSGFSGTELAAATVHGVVAQDLKTCPQAASPGVVYMDLIQRTGGLYIPICCDHYDELAHALANDVVSSAGRYPLSHPALPNTVRVSYISTGGRTQVTQGVTYDTAHQAVLVEVANRPPSGAQVLIAYTTP